MPNTIAQNLTRLNNAKEAIAEAITTKGGELVSGAGFEDFADAINSLPSSGSATLISKAITQNGTYNALSDNADGYSAVTVEIPASIRSCYLSVLDPSKVLSHYEMAENGGVTSSNDWYVTDYIDIRSSTKLIKDFYAGMLVCYYDINKNFISYSYWSASDSQLISNMPTGTKYIRTNGQIDKLNTDRILLYYPDGYSSAATLVTKTITQNGTYTASADNADGYGSVTVDVYNMFDYTITEGIKDNKYINKSGVETSDSNYYISYPIPVIPQRSYMWYFGPSTYHTAPTVAFYDSSDNYISAAQHESRAGFTFTVPQNAAYARASVYKADKASAMFTPSPIISF